MGVVMAVVQGSDVRGQVRVLANGVGQVQRVKVEMGGR